MDDLSDVRDLELFHSSDSLHKPMKELESPRLNYDSDAGAIKYDYFSLDSDAKYPKKAPSEDEESPYQSDNPSWVDPESFHISQAREFWSDESIYTDRREIGQLAGERQWISDLESESRDSISENGEKEIEKRWDAWWKFPFEMIRLCVLPIRPVWSLSVAAAILGVAILGRKLLRSEDRYDSTIPWKMVLDEKRASQMKSRAGRLNEAFSVVRRVPLIRASFPASAVAPWPVLGLYTE